MAFEDETSARVNTLSDNVDDIQNQLETEAREKLKIGRVSNYKFITKIMKLQLNYCPLSW